MMSQSQANEPQRERVEADYGRYEGDQSYGRQQQDYEQSYGASPVGKVYAPPADNKNLLRMLTAVISMAILFAFGVLFVVMVGGTAGWISFAVAGFVIFIIAVVAIDKIK